MDRQVGVREFRENLSRYIAAVAKGEAVTIVSRGKPVATLAGPLQNALRPPPTFGQLKGKHIVPDDFDDPMPQFEADYYGDN